MFKVGDRVVVFSDFPIRHGIVLNSLVGIIEVQNENLYIRGLYREDNRQIYQTVHHTQVKKVNAIVRNT